MEQRRFFLYLILFLSLSMTGYAGHVPDIPEELRFFRVIDASDGLADNSAETVLATLTGRMVISSIGHINFYDGTVFSHIGSEKENLYALRNYKGNYRMYFDRHHHLWMKNQGAVTCVNLTTEHFIVNIDSVFLEMGAKGRVEDLFTDAQSYCWFVIGSKIYSVDSKRDYPLDKTKRLQDMSTFGDQQLFLFYDDGEVQVCDLASGKQQFRSYAYSEDKRSIYDKSTYVLQTPEGFYQLRNGEDRSILLYLDLKTRKWSTLMELPYQMRMLTLHHDFLYVASAQGYWTINIKTGVKKHVESFTLENGRKMSSPVNTICFDRQDGMWIGTEKRGLLYSKPYLTPFKQIPLESEQGKDYLRKLSSVGTKTDTLPRHTNCVYKDSRGWTWTGTQTGLRLDKGDGSRQQLFTSKNGLLNDVVHAVVEDRYSHEIWVNTSFGITCFQIKNGGVGRAYIYADDDYVPCASYVNGKAMQLADGTIIMEGPDHVLAFDPRTFKLKTDKTPFTFYPKMVRLLVNGDEMSAGVMNKGRVILEKAVSRTREFTVNYDQNSLNITFSALNYFRPLHTFYRVRFNSSDERDWKVYSYFNSSLVDRKGLLHLSMTGLRPGNYTVEVQASMSPEDWNFEPFVLKIQVEEPWWRSTGVYLLLILIVGIIVVLNLMLYYHNATMKIKRNQEEHIFIKRILSFIDRCDQYGSEILAPRLDGNTSDTDTRIDLSNEFVEIMTHLVPFIQEHKRDTLTMRMLCDESKKDVQYLYKLINENIYKSPRMLAVSLRLQRAKELMKNTDLTIEDIATGCGFVSPNYFIANFYRTFKMTPKEYRERLS